MASGGLKPALIPLGFGCGRGLGFRVLGLGLQGLLGFGFRATRSTRAHHLLCINLLTYNSAPPQAKRETLQGLRRDLGWG